MTRAANPVKILGISKSKKHGCYTLEKKQRFFSGFRKFLADLGFGEEESAFEIYSFARPVDKKWGEPIIYREDDIKKYVDMRFHFSSKDYLIDVVFGKSRIFLIISTDKDRQEFISEKIQKFCSY